MTTEYARRGWGQCPVPECTLADAAQHVRAYALLDATVGRMAADEFDARHEAFLTCDDCGRTDGSHDYTEH